MEPTEAPVRRAAPHREPRQIQMLLPLLKHPARSPEAPGDESVTAVHPAAGGHHVADGWRRSGGLGGLSPATSVRASTGGLPHDSGANVLSRRQPGSDGLFGHRATRAPIRPNSRSESDDFYEFLRLLGYYLAV